MAKHTLSNCAWSCKAGRHPRVAGDQRSDGRWGRAARVAQRAQEQRKQHCAAAGRALKPSPVTHPRPRGGRCGAPLTHRGYYIKHVVRKLGAGDTLVDGHRRCGARVARRACWAGGGQPGGRGEGAAALGRSSQGRRAGQAAVRESLRGACPIRPCRPACFPALSARSPWKPPAGGGPVRSGRSRSRGSGPPKGIMCGAPKGIGPGGP